jgi:hypothetical protein
MHKMKLSRHDLRQFERIASFNPNERFSLLIDLALDRSMHRPFTNGPLSFIRTMTLRPVECEVTVTSEPNGLERCAAVIALGFIRSPDAVRLPS